MSFRLRAATLLLAAVAAIAPSGCSKSGGADHTAVATGPELVDLGRKVAEAKCTKCHSLTGDRKVVGPAIPVSMHQLPQDLSNASYGARITNLKSSYPDFYKASATEIDAILAEKDPQQRLQDWLMAYLRNPTFDNPTSKMQAVGLSTAERKALVAWLMTVK